MELPKEIKELASRELKDITALDRCKLSSYFIEMTRELVFSLGLTTAEIDSACDSVKNMFNARSINSAVYETLSELSKAKEGV